MGIDVAKSRAQATQAAQAKTPKEPT